jgi:hypothetical protein
MEAEELMKEALQEELGPLFVEREQHFLDHNFIKDIRETKDKITSTACGSVTKSGIAALFILLLWGITEGLKKLGFLKIP